MLALMTTPAIRVEDVNSLTNGDIHLLGEQHNTENSMLVAVGEQ